MRLCRGFERRNRRHHENGCWRHQLRGRSDLLVGRRDALCRLHSHNGGCGRSLQPIDNLCQITDRRPCGLCGVCRRLRLQSDGRYRLVHPCLRIRCRWRRAKRQGWRRLRWRWAGIERSMRYARWRQRRRKWRRWRRWRRRCCRWWRWWRRWTRWWRGWLRWRRRRLWWRRRRWGRRRRRWRRWRWRRRRRWRERWRRRWRHRRKWLFLGRLWSRLEQLEQLVKHVGREGQCHDAANATARIDCSNDA